MKVNSLFLIMIQRKIGVSRGNQRNFIIVVVEFIFQDLFGVLFGFFGSVWVVEVSFVVIGDLSFRYDD